MANNDTIIAGRVAAVNSRGFRLESEDTWRNWSKFASAPDSPDPGQQVRVRLDGQGFVRECVPVATNGQSVSAPEPTPAAPSSIADAKDLRITRLALLNTSTAILASHGKVDPAEVLTLAERLEQWVLR